MPLMGVANAVWYGVVLAPDIIEGAGMAAADGMEPRQLPYAAGAAAGVGAAWGTGGAE